jgi:Tfp pilus assembly protein PilF
LAFSFWKAPFGFWRGVFHILFTPMTETPRQRTLLICLGLAVAIIAVYWPVGHFEFINYDDPQYVTENQHMQGGLTLRELGWVFTTHYAGNWHPLTWLSHMLDWQLWGGNAGGHHLVNVFFHMSNTLLLFCVLQRMTGRSWRGALVAALFALHPLHVESVAWVAERKDVLSAFFWMLTIWAYVRYVEQFTVRGSRLKAFYGLAVLFFTLGLMSKPMVVTLPFVLLLLDYWPLGRTRWAKPATGECVKIPPSRLLKEKVPFFALAVVSCVVTYWVQHSSGAVASLEDESLRIRIANALLSYVSYLGKTFWPTSLAFFYPLDKNLSAAAAMVAGIALTGVTAGVIRGARRAPWLATGWFWFLGTLVPVIGLVQVGNQSMADRYTYIPLVGLFLMLCWSVPWRKTERPILKAVACVGTAVMFAVCMVVSRVQVSYWKDSDTLLQHALKATRNNWLAHYNLGRYLMRIGLVQEAVGHYEQAVGIRPDFAAAQNNLGGALAELGRTKEAIEHWEQALRINPNLAEAHDNLGIALARAGNVEEAIRHFNEALRISPGFAEAHYNWGVALEQAGRVPAAIGQYEQALRLNPNLPAAQNRLARLRAAP